MRAPTTISRLSCMLQHSTTRRSRLAAAGLFVSPFLLDHDHRTVSGARDRRTVGPTVWPWLTRRNATGVGAVTLVTLMVGATLVFPFAGLCGPNNDWVLFGGLAVGMVGYGIPSALAVRRPWTWPLAPLIGAAAFDSAMAIAMAAGVEWVC